MKNLKQTIITGEDFTLSETITALDIIEDVYVASVVNRAHGQVLAINAIWHINLSAYSQLVQINVSYRGKKTVLTRDEQGMFPEFQVNQLGAYTKAYAQLNGKKLAA